MHGSNRRGHVARCRPAPRLLGAPAEKYEDIAGTVFPPNTRAYLDTWKRPEELVQNQPNVPMVLLKAAPPAGADAKESKEKGECAVELVLARRACSTHPHAQCSRDPAAPPHHMRTSVPAAPRAHTPAPAPAPTARAAGAKGAPPAASRDVVGKLWAGHKDFEWLQAVFNAVLATRKSLPPGELLWELIYPRDPKDNSHVKPANGKYRVKMFIMVSGGRGGEGVVGGRPQGAGPLPCIGHRGAPGTGQGAAPSHGAAQWCGSDAHAAPVPLQDKWRTVVIDDRIPVDLFGRALVVGARPLQLWPLLLSKAVLKVMAAMRIIGLKLPNQVRARTRVPMTGGRGACGAHAAPPAAGASSPRPQPQPAAPAPPPRVRVEHPDPKPHTDPPHAHRWLCSRPSRAGPTRTCWTRWPGRPCTAARASTGWRRR